MSGNNWRGEGGLRLFLKNLLFTIVFPGTVAVLVPLRLAPPVMTGGPLFLLGCAFLALGGAIYLWCVWDFATFGRGTPLPLDPPQRLVVRGLYRFVRNPMYVGVLAVILGMALIYGAPTPLLAWFAAVAAMFHGFVVFYEEPCLRALFGADYDRYLGEVGRWLPRLFGR